MQESYWEKTLADGSKEIGTDSMIDNKIASWTRGRQDIRSASLAFQNNKLTISRYPKYGHFAKWKQLDNFAFNPATASSKRLSREVWCSVEGSSHLRAVKVFDRAVSFSLERESFPGSIPIPPGITWLVCSIGIDGKVNYRWS